MVNIVLIGELLLQVILLVAVIVLSLSQRSLHERLRHIGDEQANWEREQERRARERESSIGTQLQHLQEAWHAEVERREALSRQFEEVVTQWRVEHEVALLRRLEDLPVPQNSGRSRPSPFADWRPARLGGADLSQRDLSHRYLAQADLHAAQLAGTNFAMADLSGADLAEANLTGSILIGAKLAGANLGNAILTDADLLLADLEQASLMGARVSGCRHLTREQLAQALTDDSMRLDEAGACGHSSEPAREKDGAMNQLLDEVSGQRIRPGDPEGEYGFEPPVELPQQ